VGKSTIFSALTSAPAEVASYPFCTINPNVGVVSVPDERLSMIGKIVGQENLIPATVEFVDIAGLVKGASKGEGLGNQFLARIRETGLIVHVVRCFEDEDVAHITGRIDPTEDIEIVNIELALADLETVEKRLTRLERQLRTGNRESLKEAERLIPLLQSVGEVLGEGKPVRSMQLSENQLESLTDLNLITMKSQIYVCNVDESSLGGKNEYTDRVRNIASEEGVEVIDICGKLEAEIAVLDSEEERRSFLEDAGIAESGLSRLIRASYGALGLRTFFTKNEKEVKAWTFRQGCKAQQAAGIIHSDFEKGFIAAEVYHCEELFRYGSEHKVKEAGKLRLEGRDYQVQDGDIIFFKFNL